MAFIDAKNDSNEANDNNFTRLIENYCKMIDGN